MNTIEKKMVRLLTDLRENYHVIGIKTEFESEGARIEDMMRQKEITMLAGVPITLKIGGGEALTDIALAKAIGVGKIVAPMVESSLAVSKFIGAVHKVYTSDELIDTKLSINIETITAYNCYKDTLALANFGELSAVAIGRGDLRRSMGLKRADMDGPQVNDACRAIMQMTKEAYPDIHCIIGGINGDRNSFEVLRSFGDLFGGYETRKIIFSAQVLEGDFIAGYKKATEFEILYYTNRRAYYNHIAGSDDAYLERIQKKYDGLF